MSPDSRKVEVSGIPLEWHEDTILMLFESKKQSGGGSIQHMELDREKKIAWITFENGSGLYYPDISSFPYFFSIVE